MAGEVVAAGVSSRSSKDSQCELRGTNGHLTMCVCCRRPNINLLMLCPKLNSDTTCIVFIGPVKK